MEIKTLGDFAKRQPKLPDVAPIKARTWLYGAVGEYMSAALDYVEHTDAQSREVYAEKTRLLVQALLFDAKMHMDEGKYNYLLSHNIEDPGTNYRQNGGNLLDAITYLWGSEDTFMFRLSGGLPGSYVKALVGLKGQVRFAGYTLPQILNTTSKNRRG